MIKIKALVVDGKNTPSEPLPGGRMTVFNGSEYIIYEEGDELPPRCVIDPRSEIYDQIEKLESLQTPRRIRESALGIDNGWLLEQNNAINALRLQIQTKEQK